MEGWDVEFGARAREEGRGKKGEKLCLWVIYVLLCVSECVWVCMYVSVCVSVYMYILVGEKYLRIE